RRTIRRAGRTLSRDARPLRDRCRDQGRAQAPGLVYQGIAGLRRVQKPCELHRRSRTGPGRNRAVLRTVPAAARRMSEAAAGAPDAREQIAGLTFALIVLTPDGTIEQVNPAAENLIGRSARRLVGRSFRDVVRFSDPGFADRVGGEEAQLVA